MRPQKAHVKAEEMVETFSPTLLVKGEFHLLKSREDISFTKSWMIGEKEESTRALASPGLGRGTCVNGLPKSDPLPCGNAASWPTS